MIDIQQFPWLRFTAYLLMVIGLPLKSTSLSAVDTFSEKSVFIKKLSNAANSVLDGRTFREAIERITTANELNLWIDRGVNPTKVIEIGVLGPTVFSAIQQIAATQSCEVMPIGNVVLIGRPIWIEQLTGKILTTPVSQMGRKVNVTWDELTTPSEALAQVTGRESSPLHNLPHDLWPENEWNQIDQAVAKILIQGQFTIAGTTDNGAVVDNQGNQSGKVSRLYLLASKTLQDASNELPKLTSGIRLRKSPDGLRVEAEVHQHQQITRWLIDRSKTSDSIDIETDTFTLKQMSTSAENAFRQLAKTANLQCVIKPNAVEACKATISLEGQNVTLRSLLEMIAKQADVKIEFGNAVIIISK